MFWDRLKLALTELFTSKKAMATMVGMIITVAGKYGLQLPEDVVYSLLGLIGTFVIGQGIADVGKNFMSSVEVPQPSTTSPKLLAAAPVSSVSPAAFAKASATTVRIADALKGRVGFDPTVIITIIGTVLPLLSRCLNRNDNTTPETTRARVEELHSKNPDRFRKRTAKNVMSDTWEKKRIRVPKADALVIADAIIEDVLSQPSDEVCAVCAMFDEGDSFDSES